MTAPLGPIQGPPQKQWAHAKMDEVDQLAKDLTTIRARLAPGMKRATNKSAIRVRNDARIRIRQVTTGRTTPKYPKSITFDLVTANGTEVLAEIGPDRHMRGAQGFLGHLLENGTVHSPPKPHLVPALLAEMPRYEAAMADEAAKAVFP